MLVDTQIPCMLMRSTLSLSSGKGKGLSSPRDECCECGGANFQRDCNARKSTGKQSSGKGKQSKSWSSKGKSGENKGKSKGKSKGTKGAKGSHKGKTSKTGLSGVENSKSEASPDTQESAQTCATDTSWNDSWNGDDWNDGWSFDEWNDDWSSVGWDEGWEQTYDTSASSFPLGGLDVSATSRPKRFEWVKMNLDTGAAVNTFPLNCGPEGAGDGRFYRTSSGEWIPDGGAWQFRSLNGRLTGVHKVSCSAAEIACKGRQYFYLGHDGEFMILIHSKIGQGMRIHFEQWVNWHGKNELILVYFDKQHFQFLRESRSEIHRDQQCEQVSAVGKGVWQSSALVSPTKTLNRDVAPIGDDIEPVGESRADVEMGNEEDEELLEAEIPRVRMNPKNPTSREKQEHEEFRTCCLQELASKKRP